MRKILPVALAAWSAQASGAPLRLPENGGVLLAFVPLGAPSAALDRLFDASRGRVLSADAPAPEALAKPRRPRAPIASMLKRKDQIDRFDSLIVKNAEINRLDPSLLKAVIAAESEFKPEARSRAGALGLMQVMPKTAEGFGVAREKLLDPEANIRAGAAYLGELFRIIYRRSRLKGLYSAAPKWIVRRVIAAYNAGARFLRPRRLWRETRLYVSRVMGYRASAVARLRVHRPLNFPR